MWVTSRIAGQGLFAEQDIRQGTKIIQYIGEKITHEESERRLAAGNVYIFGLDERYALDGSTPKNTARYINHSCDPNCHTEQFGNTIWIVAIKDIEAGEELTLTTRLAPKHFLKHLCALLNAPHFYLTIMCGVDVQGDTAGIDRA